MNSPTVVSDSQWTEARTQLLAREKELTKLHDQVARERRALPWRRVAKDYGFDTPEGPRTLAQLFAGQRQLLVQHFMFGPGWEGRNERDVFYEMEWVRHHDRYEPGQHFEPAPETLAPPAAACPHCEGDARTGN